MVWTNTPRARSHRGHGSVTPIAQVSWKRLMMRLRPVLVQGPGGTVVARPAGAGAEPRRSPSSEENTSDVDRAERPRWRCEVWRPATERGQEC